MKIGVVGYSAGTFDIDKANKLLLLGFEYVDAVYDDGSFDQQIEIVSGLTNIGIPALAYKLANAFGLPDSPCLTVGIACSKAKEYECFPVDKEIIIGDEWGSESEAFIKYIDCLIRVGGGKQSIAEVASFRKLKPGAPVIEMELPREE